MDARLGFFAGLLIPLVAACGGFDPSQQTNRHNHPIGATDPTTPADPAADLGAVDPGANTTTSADVDGGTGSSGSVAAPAPVTAFTGAAAFASTLGPSTRKAAHNFAGNNPPTSPMGQACAGCHNFFMGGTIFADAAGTMPAAGVEVRARDAAGNAVSAFTDQDGNFYMPTNGGVTLPAALGVRSAATAKAMTAMVSNGACASSSCHVAGKQGPVHL